MGEKTKLSVGMHLVGLHVHLWAENAQKKCRKRNELQSRNSSPAF